MKITIVGGYPPPGGGVSIHIQRLYESLSEHLEIRVLDPYRPDQVPGDPENIIRCGGNRVAVLFKLLFHLARSRSDIVHFHLAALSAFLPFGLLFVIFARLTGAACVLTIHSGSFGRQVASFGPFRKSALRLLVALSGHIIPVNREQLDTLLNYGLKPQNATVIPAFLPPRKKHSKRVTSLVDAAHAKQQKLFLSSGNGLPLYGYHHIVRAVSHLKNRASIKLVFCIYNERDEPYLARLARQVEESGIDFHMTSNLAAEEFSWLLSHADLYIRATDRDGDAVAIREALHYGVPVIASDCVPRPAGTEQFETDNWQSLHASIEQITENGTADPPTPLKKAENPLQKISDIYHCLARKEKIRLAKKPEQPFTPEEL